MAVDPVLQRVRTVSAVACLWPGMLVGRPGGAVHCVQCEAGNAPPHTHASISIPFTLWIAHVDIAATAASMFGVLGRFVLASFGE